MKARRKENLRKERDKREKRRQEKVSCPDLE